MIKRTVYIGKPTYLKVKHQQMLIICPETQVKKAQIPIEDIALLLLDHYQITLSHQLVQLLQEHNSAVISCDATHTPLGLMLPIGKHSEHSLRLKVQVEVSEPLKKQLWKQVVESKIQNQAQLLKKLNKDYLPLLEYVRQVKSGDPTNQEGLAARYFWQTLFDGFTRNRFGDGPNTLLNYGYMVLRSMVARAVVSTGLHPTLGLFHKNKYNNYCLADDLMEPYRPFVDQLVYGVVKDQIDEVKEIVLTREVKAQLLKIATQDVWIEGKQRPLMVAISTTTASLYKCYLGEQKQLRLPSFETC